MKKMLYDYCMEENNNTLLVQWDQEKNGDLTPQNVSTGSNRKVWWRCEKDHSWQDKVNNRVGGYGCPVCAGRRIEVGYNDLATTHPHLAEQWDQEKNGDLTPQNVSAGSGKKVWWRCEKGHSWQADVNSRTRGRGCPVCAGHQVEVGYNDLATKHPHHAEQWHPEKNGDLTPHMVTFGTTKKVWWRG